MVECDDPWAGVHGEISDMQEIERLLFDLSKRYRNKDSDTEEFRASEGWCFGLRGLHSKRLAGDFDIWEHEFEMACFLCDALRVPHHATLETQYCYNGTITADVDVAPQMSRVAIQDFDTMGTDLHRVRESLEEAYTAALMHNEWG